MGDYIDYMQAISKAMYCVVREALHTVAKNGIQDNHHFFITFCTAHKDVQISEGLKKKYPDELTIIIEHQFYNLNVHDDRFEVRLSFEGKLEDLVVPFFAINRFADPGVPFYICFQYEGIEEDHTFEVDKFLDLNSSEQKLYESSFYINKKTSEHPPAKIISLNAFRKRKENNEKA
jgi:hypothetical protein